MIRLNQVDKYFNKGRSNEIHVVNGLSLELPETGMVAFFGPSGCGKTTLLNVIGGLDGFDSGELTVMGADIRKRTDLIRNKHIGFIFQNYNLNKLESVSENVADALRLCGIRDEAVLSARASAALAAVGMENYRNRTPDTLSGGQQQRVAIARAIVKNPPILLADEPTGNLDEQNTVMVMDLLKELSRTRLVLLVTHEAELVSYYCDRVIELRDGRAVADTLQTSSEAYSARKRSDIWLGELEKQSLADGPVRLEYYGDAPAAPICLTLVRQGDKYFLQADGAEVRFLDESSETKLREGVYQEHDAQEPAREIDLSALPPLEEMRASRYGRLFSFANSVKSGIRLHFAKTKKGNKALRRVMVLFAAVQVFAAALFGTAFRELSEIRGQNASSVFYLKLADKSRTPLPEKLPEGAAADSVSYRSDFRFGDTELGFSPGNFETFSTDYYSFDFTATGVYLSAETAKGLPVLAGSGELTDPNGLILSRGAADQLLEASAFGYIESYNDLIGLKANDNLRSRITGIVDLPENVFFITPAALTALCLNGNLPLASAADSPYDVPEGTALRILAPGMSDGTDSVTFRGIRFDVNEKIVRPSQSYANRVYLDWLEANGKKPLSEDEYALAQEPSLRDDPAALEAYKDAHYFDYLDSFYADLGVCLREYYFFYHDFEVWLALRGYDAALCTYAEEALYLAHQYKTEHGRYPSRSEYEDGRGFEKYLTVEQGLRQLTRNSELFEQFYSSEFWGGIYEDEYYLLNEKDYERLAYTFGPSTLGLENNPMNTWVNVYAVIHSTDPEATEAWLRSNPDLGDAETLKQNLQTPADRFEEDLADQKQELTASLITMLILFGVMSVCMYFIMRSSLMNRVRETGILRAIGVSKSNLLLRYAIEAGTLTTLTVLPGYLVSSLLMGVWFSRSAAVSLLFYYPLWMAVLLLIALYAVCLLCGTLPVITLLRKSPAEILSKYDI